MTQPSALARLAGPLARWAFAWSVLFVFLSLIVLLALDVRSQLSQLATARSDNLQWFLSQAETEMLALQTTLQVPEPDLEQVRIRYDIYYSRISTLNEGSIFASLRQVTDFTDSLAEMNAYLDRWTPVIDSSDAELRAALPAFLEDTRQTRVITRVAALRGIKYFSRTTDVQRSSVSNTLVRIGILTLSMFVLLLVLSALMLLLAQSRARQARANRDILDRIETILSTAIDAVIVTDRQGVIVEYNATAERMFGVPRAAALGRNVTAQMIPGFLDALTRNSGEASGQIVQCDAAHASGTRFVADLSVTQADSQQDEILIGFVRDASTRIAAESALRDTRDRALAGERQKAELLAIMSHEMRTPLNGILGTLDLVDRDKLDERHRSYLEIVRNSSNLLVRYVTDVLDILRLDAGKMPLRQDRFDLIALFTEIADNQTGEAKARGNRLSVSAADPALREAYGDPDRLRHVLLNLVSNAIKFTRDGDVCLEAVCRDGLSEVEIRVIDTGAGIHPDDLERVFDDYVTVDTAYNRQNTGTGLGLGISRRLVNAMGGKLQVSSELGDGSVFWLRLSLAPPANLLAMSAVTASDDVGEHPLPLGDLRVLVVEDNEVNRMVLRTFLERDGHHVTEAQNGSDGVTRALEAQFDVILMDISMPEMDGLQALSQIRSNAKAAGQRQVPVIAVTAHALPAEVARFKEAGMSDVLVKPISAENLRRVLAQRHDPPCNASAPPSHELLDARHLDELLDRMPKARFDTALAALMREMDGFARTYDTAKIDRVALAHDAHRLSGSAGVFGAVLLTNHLRELHLSALELSLPEAREKVQETLACWTRTRNDLSVFVDPSPPPRAA